MYIGYDSPSIAKYLVPLAFTIHRARFQNCQFEETVFPSFPSSKENIELEFYSPETFTLNPDPKTALAEEEVKKIL